MSSHMAGGCPPRSAVASGPLKCELNFSAGSCAFGLFVTRRFGESERVSGPGATPPLASSPVREAGAASTKVEDLLFDIEVATLWAKLRCGHCASR